MTTHREITDGCYPFTHEKMAVFQWPERLEILQCWPLTGVNKVDKRRLRAFIKVKLFQEGLIEKTLGNEYLKREKISIDDVLAGKEKIQFSGTLG